MRCTAETLEKMPCPSHSRRPGRRGADFYSPRGGDISVDVMSFELYLRLKVCILWG